MGLFTKSAVWLLLTGSGKAVLVVAGLAFFFGGRAIHEFWGVNRAVAEVEGLALAVISGAVGLGLSAFAENLIDYKDQ